MHSKNVEENIETQFTEEEIKALNSISIVKDATYVRTMLSFLYKDDLSILNDRSWSGRTRTRIKTLADNQESLTPHQAHKSEFKIMTPEKKHLIHTKYTERIQASSIYMQEKYLRTNKEYIQKLVSYGIGNIRKEIVKKSN